MISEGYNISIISGLVWRGQYTQLWKCYRPVLLAPGWVATRDFWLQILVTHADVFQPSPQQTNQNS